MASDTSAQIASLTRTIDALNAAIAKGKTLGWPASDLARLQQQKNQAVLDRQKLYNQLSATEQPGGVMRTASTFSEWLTGIIGTAGKGVAELPAAVGKSLPFVAVAALGIAAMFFLGKPTRKSA